MQLARVRAPESSPKGVWGGAPDTNDFSAFENNKEAFGAIYICSEPTEFSAESSPNGVWGEPQTLPILVHLWITIKAFDAI